MRSHPHPNKREFVLHVARDEQHVEMQATQMKRGRVADFQGEVGAKEARVQDVEMQTARMERLVCRFCKEETLVSTGMRTRSTWRKSPASQSGCFIAMLKKKKHDPRSKPIYRAPRVKDAKRSPSIARLDDRLPCMHK